eukprot:17002-Chlamydomonas_euryale.AAC.4
MRTGWMNGWMGGRLAAGLFPVQADRIQCIIPGTPPEHASARARTHTRCTTHTHQVHHAHTPGAPHGWRAPSRPAAPPSACAQQRAVCSVCRCGESASVQHSQAQQIPWGQTQEEGPEATSVYRSNQRQPHTRKEEQRHSHTGGGAGGCLTVPPNRPQQIPGGPHTRRGTKSIVRPEEGSEATWSATRQTPAPDPSPIEAAYEGKYQRSTLWL